MDPKPLINAPDQSSNPTLELIHDKSHEPTINVKVYSPYQVYFDKEAYSISAINQTGPFDILPNHHNFLSLLVPCELRIHTSDGVDQRIRIARGIMHVKDNQVRVFLDI